VTWRFCASAQDSSFTQSRELLGLLRQAGCSAEASTLGSGVEPGRLYGVGFGLRRRRAGVHPVLHTSRFGTMNLASLRRRGSQGHRYEQWISTLPVHPASDDRFGGREQAGRHNASVLGRFERTSAGLGPQFSTFSVSALGSRFRKSSLHAGFRRDCGTHRATFRRRTARATRPLRWHRQTGFGRDAGDATLAHRFASAEHRVGATGHAATARGQRPQ
jgi:hypothetical protein